MKIKYLNHKNKNFFSAVLLVMIISPFLNLTMVKGEIITIDTPKTSESISWTTNGSIVCNATLNQDEPKIIADGEGGAIIVWRDRRIDSDYDIYAQRIDSNGNNATGWSGNGTAICAEGSQQRYPELTSDGAGGAIIVWQDWRGAQDIYAQRINSTGGIEWAINGIAVCNAGNSQSKPQIISDGNGGAIIVWSDFRNGAFSQIFAVRINSSGGNVAGWAANGNLICDNATGSGAPHLVSDGAGGAIIVWEVSGNPDIYVQKINSVGATQWTANGVLICNATSWQYNAKIVSDGAGGAIMTWADNRVGTLDIYAQRVNSAGTPQWTPNGTVICNNVAGNGENPQIISDGDGGAIITWNDGRVANDDIYAQKINNAGATQWTPNGTAVCNADQTQGNPTIVSDGAGGAIITFENDTGSESDIYAQRINAAGALQWATNGTLICTATDDQRNPQIASDGDGGAIIVWDDGRGTSANDIYAQRILDPLPPEDGTPSNGSPDDTPPPGIPGFDLMILGLVSFVSVLLLIRKKQH